MTSLKSHSGFFFSLLFFRTFKQRFLLERLKTYFHDILRTRTVLLNASFVCIQKWKWAINITLQCKKRKKSPKIMPRTLTNTLRKNQNPLFPLLFLAVLALQESSVSSGAFSAPTSWERQHLSLNIHTIKWKLPQGICAHSLVLILCELKHKPPSVFICFPLSSSLSVSQIKHERTIPEEQWVKEWHWNRFTSVSDAMAWTFPPIRQRNWQSIEDWQDTISIC